MKRAGWGVAAAAFLMVAVVVGYSVLREKREASAQEQPDTPQRATDLPGGGGGSPWLTSVVPTTGKPNQVVHMINTALASAIDTISVEVYKDEDTPGSWARVTSLKSLGPEALVYELQPLHDGTVLVRFGDGKHGARPPKARKGIRLRYPAGLGGEGQCTSLEIETSPAGGRRSMHWARGTVWDESAEVLRKHAGEQVFEVTTLRALGDGFTEIKLYEVPGARLHTFLTEANDWLVEGQTIVSVGPRR